MNWFKHWAIALIAFCCLGGSSAKGLPAQDISQVDSSYTSGMAYLVSDRAYGAIWGSP